MFGQYEVFRRAKEKGIKVMLDGQGADELFCGYHYVFPVRLFSLLKGRRYAQFFRELFYDAMKVSNGLITHEDSTNFENTLMGKRKYDYIIWRCICLGAWIKRFDVNL